MYVRGVVDEDFVNYKKPSMFISCRSCSFKCDAESGEQVCQNGALASAPETDIPVEDLVRRYLSNDITKAVVFGGLEPFDDIDNVMLFCGLLRHRYGRDDDIVIYTGYTEREIADRQNYYSIIKNLGNVIIKFGRYVPRQEKHYDDVLGVYLASDNQYARRI